MEIVGGWRRERNELIIIFAREGKGREGKEGRKSFQLGSASCVHTYKPRVGHVGFLEAIAWSSEAFDICGRFLDVGAYDARILRICSGCSCVCMLGVMYIRWCSAYLGRAKAWRGVACG